MDPVLFFVGAGVLAAYVARYWSSKEGGALPEAWETAAEAAGLQDVSTTTVKGQRRLEASHGSLRVVITAQQQAIEVWIEGLAAGIQIRPQTPPIFGMSFPPDGLETGDARFDREYVAKGEPLLVYALLGSETRELLMDFLWRRGDFADVGAAFESLDGGRLKVAFGQDAAFNLAKRLRAMLGPVLALCNRLTEPGAPEYTLARSLASETEPMVRRLRLALLVAERRDHSATDGALRAALSDPDDDVRLVAGRALGAEGHAVLHALACNHNVTDTVAARAIDGLGTALPAADGARLLADALRGGQRRTALACLASRALSGEAEPLVVGALTHEDENVRVASARALGRLGSASAVPALRDVESSGTRDLRGAAREAIASIQSRLTGAGPGQLALAPGAGEVSLTDTEAGRVSLPSGGRRVPPEP